MTDVLIPAEVFPPGEYLREELAERGWTAAEFAEIIGRPAQVISEILTGKKQIVPDTALEIGEALGTSAEMWTNLQSAFNLFEAKSKRPAPPAIRQRARLRSLIPVTELKQRGWLSNTDDVDVLESEVKELLGVADLDEAPDFEIAARRSNADVSLSPSQLAWVARLRQLSASKSVAEFDLPATKSLASELAHRLREPLDLGKIESWLADLGIIVVTLLPLKSSKLDGAVMMNEDGTPVIGLTSRGNRMDGYVFTLLHELAHVCLGHVAPGDLRTDEAITESRDLRGKEAAANRQASDWILPRDLVFPEGRPSVAGVYRMALSYRVHPCFVIGRLQRERDDWGLLRREIPQVRSFVDIEK